MLYWIGKWQVFKLPGLPKHSSQIIFILKFLSGLTLTWIYTNYYTDRSTADLFKLFDDSRFMHEALFENPKDFFKMITGLDNNAPYFDHYYFKMNNWYRPYDVDYDVYYDTRTLIRLNAFVRIFSLGVFAVHTLVWCFLSMIGLSLIYKACYRYFFDKQYWLVAAVFLMPSVLCWGSGVLKEGVVFFWMGMLIYSIFQWINVGFKVKYLFAILFSILGFSLLKVHILFAFIPGLIAYTICRIRNFQNVRFTYLIVLAFIVLIGFNIQLIFPSINFIKVIAFKQQALLRLAYYTDSGSLTEMNPLDPSLLSFLRNWPQAMINAGFRPSLLDAQNAMQWFAAFENLFITISFLLCIGLYQPIEDPKKRAFVWFCISFTLVLYSIMGLTTPILGTLVRYRMPALPFLMMAIILLTDLNRLSKLFNNYIGKNA
jgi:hypothetical protein